MDGRANMGRTASQSLDGVQVAPLVFKFQLYSVGDNVNWRFIDLDLPQILNWGPHLTELTVHTKTENRTPNHDWKVVAYWSVDEKSWSLPQDLSAVISADGSVIHTAVTDKTKFGGLKLRLALAVKNSSGTAIESAIVTAAVVFDFRR